MKCFIEYNIISREIQFNTDDIDWREYGYDSYEEIPDWDKRSILEEFLSNYEDDYYFVDDWIREIVFVKEGAYV